MKELYINDNAAPIVAKIIRRGLALESCPEVLADELLAWCIWAEKVESRMYSGTIPTARDIYRLGQIDPWVCRALDLYRDGVFRNWEECMMALVIWLIHQKGELEGARAKDLISREPSVITKRVL